jgi:hypothetical protein
MTVALETVCQLRDTAGTLGFVPDAKRPRRDTVSIDVLLEIELIAQTGQYR